MNKDTHLIFEAYDNAPPPMPPHLLEEGAWDNIKNWWLDPERGPIQWIKKNPKKTAAAGGIIAALGAWYGIDADTAQGLVDAAGGAEALSGGADIFNDPNWSSAIEQMADYGFTEDQIGEIASNIDFPNDNQEVLDAVKDYMNAGNNPGDAIQSATDAVGSGPEIGENPDGTYGANQYPQAPKVDVRRARGDF